MPLISRSRDALFAFQFGRQSGLRSTDELVDQLQETLRRERAQHAYNMQKEQELALVLRELAEARYELAKRDTVLAFAAAPSPSTRLH